MTRPLGFNNTYAIGVKNELAEQLKLRTISDLRKHPRLVLGFGNEFMDRADGWPGLQRRYQLPQRNVRGLDHDLAYRGIESGTLHVTDLYATDAEIAYYNLRALEDDLNYFPVYNAVILYRADLIQRAPEVVALFKRLAGRIDAPTMSEMNARVKLHGEAESVVAANFLEQNLKLDIDLQVQTRGNGSGGTPGNIWCWSGSLYPQRSLCHSAGHPGSAPCARRPYRARHRRPYPDHSFVGAVCVYDPATRHWRPPAVVALFLYSLLPIIRNTYAGLKDIPPAIVESAQALGSTVARKAAHRGTTIGHPRHSRGNKNLGGHQRGYRYA